MPPALENATQTPTLHPRRRHSTPPRSVDYDGDPQTTVLQASQLPLSPASPHPHPTPPRSVNYDGDPLTTVLQASAQAAGIYDAGGGSVVDPIALASLFGPVLPKDSNSTTTGTSSNNVVDFPSAHFDEGARRWVLAAAYSDWNWDTTRPGQPLLAVSLTEDPAGDWKVYALPDPGGVPGIASCSMDTHYPVIYNAQSTLDGNGIYITGEVLCSALDSQANTDGFAGSFIYAVPKAVAYDAKLMGPVNIAVYSDLQVRASADSMGGAPAEWVQLQPARPQTAADAAASKALFVSQVGGDWGVMCCWSTGCVYGRGGGWGEGERVGGEMKCNATKIGEWELSGGVRNGVGGTEKEVFRRGGEQCVRW